MTLAHAVRTVALALLASAAGSLPCNAQVTVDVGSLGPSLRVPGATGVWVQYAPGLSVDCSPPRGCLAATQRIYYVFNCNPRYAVAMERISYDLGGNIVNQEVRDPATGFPLSYDGGANAVLNAFCPVRAGSRPL